MSPKDEVLAAYQGEQGRRYHEGKVLPARMYNCVARARALKFQQYVTRTARVLEFGVGQGYNLAMLECGDKVGVDIAGFLATRLESRGVRFVANFSSLRDGSFDVVVCHHVLEHVSDPWTTLEEFLRVLKPSGTLLLFVPYEREMRYRRYNATDRNGHMFSWTPHTIANLAVKAGFRLESLGFQKFAYDRFAAVIADKFGGGFKLYCFVRRVLLFLKPEYEIQVILRKAR